jgi:hypothetical protein
LQSPSTEISSLSFQTFRAAALVFACWGARP